MNAVPAESGAIVVVKETLHCQVSNSARFRPFGAQVKSPRPWIELSPVVVVEKLTHVDLVGMPGNRP